MWFYAALAMSAISGLHTVLSKHTLKGINSTVFYWVGLVASLPFIFFYTLTKDWPSFDGLFFVGVIGSVVFYSGSKIIYYHTLKNTEISHIHPLVTIGPIFTLFFSFVFLSESATTMSILGSIITLVGAYILNISQAREGILEPIKVLFRSKWARLMLVAVFIGSIVSIFDKIAINHTFPEHSSFALLIEDLFIIVAMAPWVFVKREEAIKEIKENKKLILLLGILGAASNILAFIAISGGNPGLVSSVFRTQVFFALLFSSFFLGDYPKRETILGTVIMILGLVVTKLGS